MGINLDICLVDEVMAVGDAAFRHKSAVVFRDRIRGSSALVVNHHLAELRDYCDAALIFKAGKLNYYAELNEVIKAHKAMLSWSSDIPQTGHVRVQIASRGQDLRAFANQITGRPVPKDGHLPLQQRLYNYRTAILRRKHLQHKRQPNGHCQSYKFKPTAQ